MITAIDDFGAEHVGLNMLADFQPDVIIIDMALTRAVNSDPVRHEIMRAVIESGPAVLSPESVRADGPSVRAAGVFIAINLHTGGRPWPASPK
jgi:predicted signal transduction protein with EAL and GGDEF domain